MKRIVVTGAKGLLGWHAHVQLHAANCAAGFNGSPLPFDIIALDHDDFDNNDTLQLAVKNADAILHFAGVNRGLNDDIIDANPDIARRLVEACQSVKADPHVVYANSIHASTNTPYGKSKRQAGQVLQRFANRYTDLRLPHIFGECAKPFYNNVTATFVHQIINGEPAAVNPDGQTQLMYAGEVARLAIRAIMSDAFGLSQPTGRPMSAPDLLKKLKSFHDSYHANKYPDLSDPFDLYLFNSYRAATYPSFWPRHLHQNTDMRGTLFEAVKGGGGGQTFLSTTHPNVTRGNHFHLNKVERFLVVKGEAIIRIRKVLSEEVWEYQVTGDTPTAIDMPTLHTHSIENIGNEELVTLFWTHEMFDPNRPDTFADKVLQ